MITTPGAGKRAAAKAADWVVIGALVYILPGQHAPAATVPPVNLEPLRTEILELTVDVRDLRAELTTQAASERELQADLRDVERRVAAVERTTTTRGHTP